MTKFISFCLIAAFILLLASCENSAEKITAKELAVENTSNIESKQSPTKDEPLELLLGKWQLAILENGNWKKVISEPHFGIEFRPPTEKLKTPRIILTTIYGISENHEVFDVSWSTDTNFVLNCAKDNGIEAILHPTWSGCEISVIEIINSNKIQDLFQDVLGNNSRPYEMIFYKSTSGQRPLFLEAKDKIAIDYSLELDS